MYRWLVALLLLVCSIVAAPGVEVTSLNNGLYPPRATPIANSATGTTGATSATLAAASGVTTYICGFVITSGGTGMALVGNATVVGTIGGTLNFTYVDVSSGQGLLGVAFPLCLPATGQNVSIVVTAPAGGASTVVAVTAWGFQL
jgi:hypothetical protein